MYIAYHIQSNLERGGVSTKEIFSTIFSLLSKRTDSFSVEPSVRRITDRKKNLTPSGKCAISNMNNDIEEKEKERDVVRVRSDHVRSIYEGFFELETEHPREFAIFSRQIAPDEGSRLLGFFNYRL